MEQTEKSSVDEALKQSGIVQHLRELLVRNPQEAATASDIKELKDLVEGVIPSFYGTLNTPDGMLRPLEYNVCLLIRAFFTPAEIGRLMARSDAHIAVLRRRILKKRWGIDGSPKDLDAILLNTF
jgi:hypothetical protein